MALDLAEVSKQKQEICDLNNEHNLKIASLESNVDEQSTKLNELSNEITALNVQIKATPDHINMIRLLLIPALLKPAPLASPSGKLAITTPRKTDALNILLSNM